MVKLLIVDDEIQIRTGIRDSINWKELEIQVCGLAGCVSDALDMIELQAPDIIIIDICMPQISGLELLEITHDQYPNIRVILISGSREFENARAAVNLNAFAFIAKPIDIEELCAVLCRARDEIQSHRDMLQKEATIAAKMKENLSLLRDTFLVNVASGKFASADEAKARAATLDLRFDTDCFMAALIVQDGGQQEEKRENLFRGAALSWLEQVFPRETVYCFNLAEGIGFLSCTPQANRETMDRQFHRLISWLNKEAGFHLTIIAAEVCHSLEEIPLAFRPIGQALDYKMMIGGNQVIYAEQLVKEIHKGEPAHIDFYSDLLGFKKNLILALKDGDSSRVQTCGEEIGTAFIHTVEMSMAQKQNIQFLLAFFLYQMQIEVGAYSEHAPVGADEIYRGLCESGSQTELKRFVSDFLGGLQQELHKRDLSQRNFLVERAMEYIMQNLHKPISLVDAADCLHIHPSYLSKIFKGVTEKSFTEYVSNAKMKEAKRLLQTTTMRVYEISELLSYHDPGYFIKLFKKVYGVSPGEFRQL